jgi:hypothetical protein
MGPAAPKGACAAPRRMSEFAVHKCHPALPITMPAIAIMRFGVQFAL